MTRAVGPPQHQRVQAFACFVKTDKVLKIMHFFLSPEEIAKLLGRGSQCKLVKSNHQGCGKDSGMTNQ